MTERTRVVWATVVPGLPIAVVLEPALTGGMHGWVPFLATAVVAVHGGLMLSAAATGLHPLIAVGVVLWMMFGLVVSGMGLFGGLIALADDGPRIEILLAISYVAAVIYAYILQLRRMAVLLGGPSRPLNLR